MPEVKPEIETFAKIKVVGVGGGGGSAINRMIENGIKGVEFVAVNTDIQALHYNKASEKIHIGKSSFHHRNRRTYQYVENPKGGHYAKIQSSN